MESSRDKEPNVREQKEVAAAKVKKKDDTVVVDAGVERQNVDTENGGKDSVAKAGTKKVPEKKGASRKGAIYGPPGIAR